MIVRFLKECKWLLIISHDQDSPRCNVFKILIMVFRNSEPSNSNLNSYFKSPRCSEYLTFQDKGKYSWQKNYHYVYEDAVRTVSVMILRNVLWYRMEDLGWQICQDKGNVIWGSKFLADVISSCQFGSRCT